MGVGKAIPKRAPYTVCMGVLCLVLGWGRECRAAELIEVEEAIAVSVEYRFRGKSYQKEIFCFEERPGLARVRGDKLRFTSLREKIRKIRKRGNRRATKRLKQIRRAGKVACSEAVSSPSPSPSPSASLEPYFLEGGTVTDAGKEEFRIPPELDANTLRGEVIYLQHCSDCHEERRNRTFTNLRQSIDDAPMFFTEQIIPDQDLADLTAYLNRFREP